jgi:hypothetical protein
MQTKICYSDIDFIFTLPSEEVEKPQSAESEKPKDEGAKTAATSST